MTEFTKGPWVAFKDPYSEKGRVPYDLRYMIGFSDYPEFSTIASVQHGASDDEYGGASAVAANAHLIAAAPELFHALERLVVDMDDDLDIMVHEAAISNAERALAKARGES